MTKSDWLRAVPLELMRINISVTSSISREWSSSITPICRFAIPVSLLISSASSSRSTFGLFFAYSFSKALGLKLAENRTEMSGIHFLSFKWDASWTANRLLSSAARGLNAILIRSFLKSSSKTSFPEIAAIKAVIRC